MIRRDLPGHGFQRPAGAAAHHLPLLERGPPEGLRRLRLHHHRDVPARDRARRAAGRLAVARPVLADVRRGADEDAFAPGHDAGGERDVVEEDGGFVVAADFFKIRDIDKDYLSKSGHRLDQMIQFAEKNGFVSPRYMHYVNAQTAYLSDFKSQYISIIDPVSFEKKAQISCPGWTEGFIPLYSEVWACNPFKDYVYCISEQHNITDSIKVAKSFFSGVKDAKDRVWLMSAPYNDSGVLYALDVQSRQIVQKLDLKGKALSQLVLNERKDTLFFIQQDLWYLALNQPNALPAPYITLNAMNPYGFGKDPRSGRFYISDVKDYTSRSEIFVYNAKGQPLTSFNAGVNASGFYFK